MKIKVIGASAGTGKTYRLIEALAQRLTGTPKVEPESVIAVTFTNAAADELRARVRNKLFEKKMLNEARRMEGALIGTVHAVCHALLQRFAFEAGLPPELVVLPEEQAKALFSRSMARVLTPDRMDPLTPAMERLQLTDPADDTMALARLARQNGIPGDALAAMGRASADRYLSLFSTPAEGATAETMDKELLKTIAAVMPKLEAAQQAAPVIKTQTFLDHMARVRDRLKSGALTWADRGRLVGGAAQKHEAIARPLVECAQGQLAHPQLHQDIRACTEAVFDLAARSLETYQQWKRERGLLDFTDLEALALDLVSRPAVERALKGEFSLLLVDEFQDTSPLQLALFARLGRLVDEMIWVGDKKQSIFAFRDADPALMDAAYAEAVKGRPPERLRESRRSRKPLVDFTSAVFARAFHSQGYAREDVEITAYRKKDPPGMALALECWIIPKVPKGEGANLQERCITEGVQALLGPAGVRIEDPVTGEVRKAEPGDIAVLRRSNAGCGAQARFFEESGIQAALPQTGLTDTPEAVFLRAALEVALDRRASLPAFLVLHLMEPGAAVARLQARIDEVRARPTTERRPEPWQGHPVLEALRALQDRSRVLSPAMMVDAVIEASGLRSLCLRWDYSARRLANVEQLRAHARQYEASGDLTGEGVSPAGFLAYLDGLEEGGDQALWASREAVTVSTYHKAKGREWPIVILGDLDPRTEHYHYSLAPRAWMGPGGFSFDQPLEGRTLRFCPWPYADVRKNAPLWDRLKASADEQEAEQRDREEQMRLLYVGFTRARDYLVLPCKASNPQPKRLQLLFPGLTLPVERGAGEHDFDIAGLSPAPKAKGTRKGRGSGKEKAEEKASAASGPPIRGRFTVRQLTGNPAPDPRTPGSPRWFARPAGTPPQHAPKFLNASELPSSSAPASPPSGVLAVVSLGARLPFGGRFTKDEPAFGDAVHGFMAADRPEMGKADRLALAQRLLDAYDAAKFLQPEALVEAANRLYAWAQKQYPDATLHRELPIQLRRGEQVVAGTADLVLEKADGFLLLDHKGFPGDEAQCKSKALTFIGQLDAYAEALKKALHKPCLGRFIHFPVQGLLVELS
jgi:ATP-dependent exoDNAse (exonuclease V) beta subunit